MSIKEITVGIQRVINLGNYENVRYECSVVASIDEGASVKEEYDKALALCKEKVGAEIDRLSRSA